MNSSFLLPNHHTQLGAALSQFQLAEAGIMEFYLGLARGFEASTSSSAANSAELEEMKRKLVRSEEDLNLLRQQVRQAQASEKNLAGLRADLEKVWLEAEQHKAAAQKSVEELAKEQKTRRASQARISEIEEDLKSATAEYDALKVSCEKDVTELKKLKLSGGCFSNESGQGGASAGY